MSGKPVRFTMLVSPREERIQNAYKIKEAIPELEIVNADISKEDIFQKHLDTLVTSSNKYCGVVMMEDDIILCKDFREKLDAVISEHENDVVQFFERALAKNPLKRGYANGGEFFSCVCYYLPAHISQIIGGDEYVSYFKEAYLSKGKEPWTYPIDTYIQFFLKYNKLKYWREFPFIVQHSNFKSMLGNRSTKRQSKFFIDDL